MQIHELTRKKNTELEEGIADTIGGAVGKTVSGVKNVGSAIASPFKNVAQGYSTARQDQKVSAMADKAFRAWQKYVAQLEQSIAAQPAPVTAPVKTAPGTTAATATKDAGATATPAPTTAPATTATPNYGAQTGAGAKVTYNQPTGGIPNTNTTQPTNTIGPKTPGATVTTPAGTTTTPAKTVASTAPGQPITVGGQKIKPGQPGYDQLAKATLKELQTPAAAVSPAVTAFRNRTDGKYEAYLTAFVQKNLLAGMGFKGLVNQQEITNAIKAIASPANADPAKQRPLWNDLVRAAALAVPAAGALTGRNPSAAKPTGQEAPVGYKINDGKGGTITKTDKGWFRSADNYLIPTNSLAHKDYEGLAAQDYKGIPNTPGEEPTAQAEPAKPTMTKDQIRQWIARNSEDPAVLKAALDAINAVKG
jgi:hypothetical protein